MYQDKEGSGFQRHVRACNNVSLPGERIPFLIAGQGTGWVSPGTVAALRGMGGICCAGDSVTLTDPEALPRIARALAERGVYRWRGEAFDVRAKLDGPVLAQIDRGAIPLFGTQAVGVHVNGLVCRADGVHVWIARRAMDRALDPGKLDQVVAGGIPAGLSPGETLVKEAGEEAAIAPALASTAVHVGEIGYMMERAEGLRRDWLQCYDLMLPEDFTPVATDGEVEAFELWPLGRVAEAVRDTEMFKFNVNLVLIDLFLRQGLITGPEAGQVRAEIEQGTRLAASC